MPARTALAASRPAVAMPELPRPDIGSPSSLPLAESVKGLDGDALRSFRVALAKELRQFRRYPDEALKQGWSGIAEVHLPIDASGAVLAPRIARSSGHAGLDEQALEMVRMAAPRTLLPDVLRGHGFVLSLPIEFAIGDD